MINSLILSERKTSYVVNTQKRTIVCLIYVHPNTADDILNKYLEASGLDTTSMLGNYIWSPFIGIAKCHPSDKWDEEIGKKIARERAEKKLQCAINLSLKQYVKRLRHAADLIEQYGVKNIK